jgi:hypothetical protein
VGSQGAPFLLTLLCDPRVPCPMTTTKSYLAGLGMTGIVIASVLVLLAVGTGLVAFDETRDAGGARAPLDRVVVGKGPRAGERGRAHKRDEAPPVPAAAARVPVASSPVAPQRSPGTTHGATRERSSTKRPGRGHGGVQARTRGSLGGGAPARDATEDGGGAAADGPPGRAKRGAGPPPGHAKNGAPIGAPGRSTGRLPGHGRALGGAKRRVEDAVGSGALPAPLP